VTDPDLSALVAGYARRQRAPLWPVALVIVVIAASLLALTLGFALGWNAQIVGWVLGLALIAYAVGVVVLFATQRGLSRAAARNRLVAGGERRPR
jgi:hypothetical protein